MLDDSDDFTEPTRRGTTSGKTKTGNAKSVKVRGNQNHTVLIHPKWETASFVTRLKALLQESNAAGDQQQVEFKSEPLGSFNRTSSGGGSSVLGNVSLNSSIGGSDQLDLEAEDLSVLILTEPEYVGAGNNVFKRRLAKLVTSKTKDPVHTVVVAVRSARTPPQDFLSLQAFCTIDLGLALIPISDNLDKHLPQLLVQLINSRGKKKSNPYKQGQARSAGRRGPLGPILTTLLTVPGVSEKKAKDLVVKFGSVQAIAKAEVRDLTPILGQSTASSVHQFFRLETAKKQ